MEKMTGNAAMSVIHQGCNVCTTFIAASSNNNSHHRNNHNDIQLELLIFAKRVLIPAFII